MSPGIERRLDALAKALGRILEDLELLEVGSRERGEGRTWPVLSGLVQRLRRHAHEAADLADLEWLPDSDDDP